MHTRARRGHPRLSARRRRIAAPGGRGAACRSPRPRTRASSPSARATAAPAISPSSIGEPDPAQPVLVRLHSECFTGDLLGSLRCDCGDQLRGAIAEIARAGGGVLLYLAQEGRGIGLVNKLRAYNLQDAGLDTFDANEQLGFDADERVYLPAAEMLRQLGFTRVRLHDQQSRQGGGARRAAASRWSSACRMSSPRTSTTSAICAPRRRGTAICSDLAGQILPGGPQPEPARNTRKAAASAAGIALATSRGMSDAAAAAAGAAPAHSSGIHGVEGPESGSASATCSTSSIRCSICRSSARSTAG